MNVRRHDQARSLLEPKLRIRRERTNRQLAQEWLAQQLLTVNHVARLCSGFGQFRLRPSPSNTKSSVDYTVVPLSPLFDQVSRNTKLPNWNGSVHGELRMEDSIVPANTNSNFELFSGRKGHHTVIVVRTSSKRVPSTGGFSADVRIS